MSAIKVNFEIGHDTSLRTKKTPEGFTHDWEVFVRGQEGAEISHFVDKVVFHLHETFQKPKRVVKEQPYSVKESGYAGFIIAIDIYLKNKDDPKKITFSYDLNLAQGGCLKDRYVFQNPSDEFRKKLLKGGGIPISNNNVSIYTNPDQENRSRDSFPSEKLSKTKLSSDNVKKHKSKEHKDEIPHRTSSFENLFGPPIQKPPKVSPDPKKLEKTSTAIKPDKKEKDKSSSDKKSKYENKELKPEKAKLKEEKEKPRIDKLKSHSKEPERSKEKSKKRTSERPPSPEPPKKKLGISPSRKVASPPPRSSSASSIKEETYKPPKHSTDAIEHKKQRIDEKPVKPEELKPDKDLKEKKKKEKKSHDKDKERKEKKEHKKESHKAKETPKEIVKEIPKPREIPKEKEIIKEPVREKPPKPEKPINKFSIENLRKSPPPEIEERPPEIQHKSKEKGDPERKHKHKKKDKKRDESKEKHKESSKEKKHKHRELPPEKQEVIERRETPTFKERPLPEPASPISLDTASQCSSKSGLAKMSQIGGEDANSSHSESESSMIADEEDTKKAEIASPIRKRPPSPDPEPEVELEPEYQVQPEPEADPDPVVEPPTPHKEKVKKHKDKKEKREEKRRKRKANEEEGPLGIKVAKNDTASNEEHGESSGSMSIETKVQDNGVSSSLGEDAEPGDLSPDYMSQLKGLQKRIMMIKNNEDLERVVNLIAETGRYEVTTQTFDFDLCLLDRSTVQQLIHLVGC